MTYKGNQNSQGSIMLSLIEALLHDLGIHHQISPREIARDFAYMQRRTNTEGVSFLTKTLPLLGKRIDASLLAEEFTPISEFKRGNGTSYPSFLRGLLELVFERDGGLKESPDVAAIQSLRQVCYLFYKYQIPYQDRTVKKCFANYVAVDANIQPLVCDAQKTSTIYFAQEVVNATFRNFVVTDSLMPKNGPGSVAGGQTPWERFKPSLVYENLEDLAPYDHFYGFNDRHLFDCLYDLRSLDYEEYGTAKLLAVPKDSRGPRLISKEPMEFMHYQQAISIAMRQWIEDHPLTSGHVNFRDQDVNGQLALSGSIDGKLATLDLSEASDRLTYELVDALFEDTNIHKWILQTRSEYSQVDAERRIHLKKYAPMGNALTFPVQSMCFYALLVGALLAEGVPMERAAKSVWVYGDDIIISTSFVPDAIKTLESMGLKVNADKSCYSGHFRESCGVDAYKGVDVTPVKIKKVWTSQPEPTTIQSWIDSCDNLFRKGYWHASDFIKKLVEESVGYLPIISSSSPLMGWTTWSRDHLVQANSSISCWSDELQCCMYPGYQLRNKATEKLHRGWERMLNLTWSLPRSKDAQPARRHYDEIAFSTGLFTVRHAVTKQRVLVPESML